MINITVKETTHKMTKSMTVMKLLRIYKYPLSINVICQQIINYFITISINFIKIKEFAFFNLNAFSFFNYIN